MMSTRSKQAEHGTIQSSIGLLRERFRQLERVKEMRENKELLRMFSDYKHTNNNNNNILSCTNTNSTTTTSTITRDPNINININIKDKDKDKDNDTNTIMHYNDNVDDELQIFIPPNYMRSNNPTASCYSSPLLSASATSTATSTTTSSSSYNNNHIMINLNDISLSLWPPMACNNHVTPQNSGDLLSTMNTVNNKRPSCVLSEYNKMDESRHVSDVDTTLHL